MRDPSDGRADLRPRCLGQQDSLGSFHFRFHYHHRYHRIQENKTTLVIIIAIFITSSLPWNPCQISNAKVDIMGQFFTQDMIYDTNWAPDGVMGNTSGIEDWFYSEHIPWNLAFDNATFTQVGRFIFKFQGRI